MKPHALTLRSESCEARGLRAHHGNAPADAVGLADSPIDLAAFMRDHGDGTAQPGLVK
jgi:hypothetical protein